VYALPQMIDVRVHAINALCESFNRIKRFADHPTTTVWVRANDRPPVAKLVVDPFVGVGNGDFQKSDEDTSAHPVDSADEYRARRRWESLLCSWEPGIGTNHKVEGGVAMFTLRNRRDSPRCRAQRSS